MDQHYAIAVLSVDGTVDVSQLRLSCRAGDDDQACFAERLERECS
jgi:hypothetical protein